MPSPKTQSSLTKLLAQSGHTCPTLHTSPGNIEIVGRFGIPACSCRRNPECLWGRTTYKKQYDDGGRYEKRSDTAENQESRPPFVRRLESIYQKGYRCFSGRKGHDFENLRNPIELGDQNDVILAQIKEMTSTSHMSVNGK